MGRGTFFTPWNLARHPFIPHDPIGKKRNIGLWESGDLRAATLVSSLIRAI